MGLKRGIDKAVARVVEELKKSSKETRGKKEIAQVGSISANNDPEIGDLIADAMEKVGKDGVITVEEARGLETDMETVDGMQFSMRPDSRMIEAKVLPSTYSMTISRPCSSGTSV